MIFELCRRSAHGIHAVPYRGRRRRKPVSLPDGAIVEGTLPDQRGEAPEHPVGYFEVAAGGVPATIHHENLGLVVAFLPYSGIYLLPSGEVAAVYGAEAVPVADRPRAGRSPCL